MLCAWYLEPLPDTEVFDVALYPERAVNAFFYSLTAIFALFTVVFFGLAPRDNPGMSWFLKSLFGGGEEGWRYIFLTTFAIGLAASFYGIALLIPDEFGWLVWLDWIFRILSLIASFFAVVLSAHAIDSFFIKPILRVASGDQESFDSYVDRFRKSAIVVVPILIALVTLIVELRKD